MNKIDISVYIITYCHEKYIEEAIKSVLNQKTHYNYEIIISDDASTDRTVDIIENYIKKYPDIIRLNKNTNNVGIPNNIYQARKMCRGRYIVQLDGDDFWIDSNKLETQGRFLDANVQYLAVGNAMELKDEKNQISLGVLPNEKERGREFTLADYEKGKSLINHGLMMRNVFLLREGDLFFSKAKDISSIIDDAVDCVLLLLWGRVFVLNEVFDGYRVLNNSNNSSNYNNIYGRYDKTKNIIDTYNALDYYFGDKINFRKKYIDVVSQLIINGLLEHDLKKYDELYYSIPKKYRKGIQSILLPSIILCFYKGIKRLLV